MMPSFINSMHDLIYIFTCVTELVIELNYVLRSFILHEGISWTVAEICGRQFMISYCVSARLPLKLSLNVVLTSSNIFFCCVFFISLSRIRALSTPTY